MRWLGLISVASVDGRWSAGPPPSRWQNFCRRQPLATTMMARPPVKNGGQNNARLSAPCQSVSNPCQSVSNPRPALGPWSIRAKVPRRTGPPVNASKSVKIRQISDPARAPTIPPTTPYSVLGRQDSRTSARLAPPAHTTRRQTAGLMLTVMKRNLTLTYLSDVARSGSVPHLRRPCRMHLHRKRI